MDWLAFLPPDKAEHALGGAAIGCCAVAIVQRADPSASWWDRVAWGTGAGIAAGALKETADGLTGAWSDFDALDLAATGVGALVGSVATATLSDALTVVVTPSRDGGSLRCSWRF